MNTAGTIPSAEDIKRVKGLGFLRDKNTKDCFNGRVITRNGKITAAESRAIAEAAERFGNGEIAMTTRLTVEIQHVPYDNIEPMRAFLKEYGSKPAAPAQRSGRSFPARVQPASTA